MNEKKLADKNNNSAGLTEKQKLFCVFYCQSFNATQSYLKAYGGKKIVARVNASKLLTKTVNFVDLVESDSVDTSVIEEVKKVKGDVTIKLADKMSALKELAKIFGFDEGERKSNLPVVIGGENDLED